MVPFVQQSPTKKWVNKAPLRPSIPHTSHHVHATTTEQTLEHGVHSCRATLSRSSPAASCMRIACRFSSAVAAMGAALAAAPPAAALGRPRVADAVAAAPAAAAASRFLRRSSSVSTAAVCKQPRRASHDTRRLHEGSAGASVQHGSAAATHRRMLRHRRLALLFPLLEQQVALPAEVLRAPPHFSSSHRIGLGSSSFLLQSKHPCNRVAATPDCFAGLTARAEATATAIALTFMSRRR